MKKITIIITIFIFLLVPLVQASWYPFGGDIFQSQTESSSGSWTNESYTTMVTTSNSGLSTDYQPLTGDIDNDGDNEIMMTDGTAIKVVLVDDLSVETTFSVGVIAGQPTLENLDSGDDLEMAVVSLKDDTWWLNILGWDGATPTQASINLTMFNGSVTDALEGASPKCWYQSNPTQWGYNVPYCFFRARNDTYVKVNINTQGIDTFSFTGANIGTAFSTPTIPILANIDNDPLAIPEFFIIRGETGAGSPQAVMLNASSWNVHESFDTGGTVGAFSSTKATDGLMTLFYTRNGNNANEIVGQVYQPTLIDVDGDSVYEIMFQMTHYNWHVSGVGCIEYSSVLGVINLDGSPEWSVSDVFSCTGGSNQHFLLRTSQAVIGDFWEGNSGNEICYFYCQGGATQPSTPSCSGSARKCVDLSGTSPVGSTSGAIPTWRNETESKGDGTWYGSHWGTGNYYSTGADLDGDGFYEYIGPIGAFTDLLNSNMSVIVTATDMGLGEDNDKAPMPVLDSNNALQLLYSDDSGNDYTGTKLYSVGGVGAVDNELPNMTTVTANPGVEVQTSQPLQFTIAGNDPEGDALYTAKRCLVTDSASSFSYTNVQTCVYSSAGVFTTRVYLTDSEHLSDYSVYQDIEITVTPASIYCGDGICGTNESVETCPADCTVSSTGSEYGFQIDLPLDFVNVNADFNDPTQQGLLGNLYIGLMRLSSKIMMPLFAISIAVAFVSVIFALWVVIKKWGGSS